MPNMQPVSTHGATRIQMNSQDKDYQAKLKAAKAQADGNPYVSGITPEDMTKMSRSSYGAPTVIPQDLTQENFSQGDSTANIALDEPTTTSGSVELGTSATKTPDEDPVSFQTEGLEERLALIARAASNANGGMNDRSETGRLS